MTTFRDSVIITLFGITLGVGCNETAPEAQDLPDDPELGITENDRADASGIQPGTPAARIVLDYVNQPLQDNTAGGIFRDELDTELHRYAASGIANFRAGADKNFGTADDKSFGSLRELDAVPWVGPVAMQKLYKLGLNAGYEIPAEATSNTITRAITTAPATSLSGSDRLVDRSGQFAYGPGNIDSFEAFLMPAGQGNDELSGQMGGATFDLRRDLLLGRTSTNLVVWEHGKFHALDRFVRNFEPDDFSIYTVDASHVEGLNAAGTTDFNPVVASFTGVDVAALATDLRGNAMVAFAKHIHVAEQELRFATCDGSACVQETVASGYSHAEALGAFVGLEDDREVIVARPTLSGSTLDAFRRHDGEWTLHQSVEVPARVVNIVAQQGYGRAVAVLEGSSKTKLFVFELLQNGWEERAAIELPWPRNVDRDNATLSARLTPRGLVISTSGCIQYRHDPRGSVCERGTWRVYREADDYQAEEIAVTTPNNTESEEFKALTPWAPLLGDDGNASNSYLEAASGVYLDTTYVYATLEPGNYSSLYNRGNGTADAELMNWRLGETRFSDGTISAECSLNGKNPGLLTVYCDVLARDLYSVRSTESWELEFELDENLSFESRTWNWGEQKVVQGQIEREADRIFVVFNEIQSIDANGTSYLVGNSETLKVELE